MDYVANGILIESAEPDTKSEAKRLTDIARKAAGAEEEGGKN